MAQQTALRAAGLPGPTQSFSAKTEAAVVVYIDMGSVFLYTSTNRFPVPLWYFEATMRATSGTAQAQLYDLTDSASVASSVVSTTSSTHNRSRSSAITLVNAHEYVAQFGTLPSDTGKARGASIVGIS